METDTVVMAANRLIAAYVRAHPDLGLVESLRASKIVGEGIGTAWTDDAAGRFTMADTDSGQAIVTVDLTCWLAEAER